MNVFRMIPLALVALVFGARACNADMIDQSYLPAGNDPLIVELNQSLLQTVTVGMGGLLSRIEVEVASSGAPPASDLFLDILTTGPGGVPTDTVLASHAFAAADVPTAFTFLGFDLGSSAFAISDGDVLAIRLSATVNGSGGIDPYAWDADFPSGYTRGAAFLNNNRGGGDVAVSFSFGFKTYVRAVPEPASLAMMFVGGLALRTGMLRRRRAAATPQVLDVS